MSNKKAPRTERIELRCSIHELASWRSKADALGLSLSSYIRMILGNNPKIVQSTSADPALIRQVALIGNNLNQLAHWVNTYKSEQDIETVVAMINNVREELNNLTSDGGSENAN